MNRLDAFEYQMRLEAESLVNQVQGCAETLGNRMTRLVAELRQKNVAASFNSLGEVQGLGGEIDRLLGQLATVRELGKSLSTFKENF